MIVFNILGYFGRNKQNSYAALTLIMIRGGNRGRRVRGRKVAPPAVTVATERSVPPSPASWKSTFSSRVSFCWLSSGSLFSAYAAGLVQ